MLVSVRCSISIPTRRWRRRWRLSALVRLLLHDGRFKTVERHGGDKLLSSHIIMTVCVKGFANVRSSTIEKHVYWYHEVVEPVIFAYPCVWSDPHEWAVLTDFRVRKLAFNFRVNCDVCHIGPQTYYPDFLSTSVRKYGYKDIHILLCLSSWITKECDAQIMNDVSKLTLNVGHTRRQTRTHIGPNFSVYRIITQSATLVSVALLLLYNHFGSFSPVGVCNVLSQVLFSFILTNVNCDWSYVCGKIRQIPLSCVGMLQKIDGSYCL